MVQIKNKICIQDTAEKPADVVFLFKDLIFTIMVTITIVGVNKYAKHVQGIKWNKFKIVPHLLIIIMLVICNS